MNEVFKMSFIYFDSFVLKIQYKYKYKYFAFEKCLTFISVLTE